MIASRWRFTGLMLTVSVVLQSAVCWAKEPDQATGRDIFQKLRQSAATAGTKRAGGEKHHDVDVAGHRFSIVTGDYSNATAPPITDGGEPVQCGISVRFQLEDGRYVNPVKHRWSASEKFNIWVESAVPVQIHVFQNFLEDNAASRTIYPDKNSPATFKTIQSGEPYKLPVTFQMDDDLRNEILSMVVARADSDLLAVNTHVAQQNATSTIGAGGAFDLASFQIVCSKQLAAMRECNNEAVRSQTIKGHPSRFTICSPDESAPIESTTPGDVEFFMLGDQSIHQFQLTLFK